MTVQERILALRLLERCERNPGYMKRLGVSARMEHRPAIFRGRGGTQHRPDDKR